MMKFDEELYQKIRKYCFVNASQIQNKPYYDPGVIQMAEWATQEVMLKLWKAYEKGTLSEKKQNNNFYFISAKFSCHYYITYNDRKMRTQYKDKGNVSLDKTYGDDEITLELPAEDYTEIENKKIAEEINDKNLNRLSEILRKSKYLNKEDLRVFKLKYIDGLTQKKIAKIMKKSNIGVARICSKLKYVLDYEIKNSF